MLKWDATPNHHWSTTKAVVFNNTGVTIAFTSTSVDPSRTVWSSEVESGLVCEQNRSPIITSPSKMGSCPCKAFSTVSCTKNRSNIWSVWTNTRCPQPVSHRLITDVMPMSFNCASGSDCSRPKPVPEMCQSNVAVVLERCDPHAALSRQVAYVTSLLKLVP